VVANGNASDELSVTVDRGSGRAQYLLVNRYASGDTTLWAYVDGEWLARSIAQADVAGWRGMSSPPTRRWLVGQL
jgi:hypothetical protein